MDVPLPIHPPLPSPQQSHTLGGPALAGPRVPLQGYSLLPMNLEPRVSPCIVFYPRASKEGTENWIYDLTYAR